MTNTHIHKHADLLRALTEHLRPYISPAYDIVCYLDNLITVPYILIDQIDRRDRFKVYLSVSVSNDSKFQIDHREGIIQLDLEDPKFISTLIKTCAWITKRYQ